MPNLAGKRRQRLLDLVLNHCAKEHEWARRARAGEAKYQDYFYIYQDRTMPDEYEKNLTRSFSRLRPRQLLALWRIGLGLDHL